MPESFEYAGNGGRKYLLRGLGNGRFEDVTEKAGLAGRRWMMAAAAADIRGTGYPDLFIANDYAVDEIYFNERGMFRPAGEETGIGKVPKSGMNVTFGDILNQGALNVYVTNISEPGVLVQGNNLWIPVPGATTGNLHYENVASLMQVEIGGWSYGAQFADFNNDGFLDLFVTNGYISGEDRRSYWYDFSKVAGGNRAIISDAKNWPAMHGRSLSGYQHKHLWLNSGNWRFDDVTMAVGIRERYDGRAVVVSDLWNRGVFDLIVAHQRGPLLVYRNQVIAAHDWIGFDLEGTKSNRSAIGAQVEVHWNGQVQLQEVSGGSGFCAQNDRRLHFGLGENAQIEKVTILWPSGKEQTLDKPAIRVIHRIREP